MTFADFIVVASVTFALSIALGTATAFESEVAPSTGSGLSRRPHRRRMQGVGAMSNGYNHKAHIGVGFGSSKVGGTPPIYLDVLDYGAVGDNKTDNTAAFQTTIAAAVEKGIEEVFVPTGLYVFEGNLTLPPGITLRGSYDSVPSHQFPDETTPMTDGTVLIPHEGRGIDCDLNCTAFFIYVSENAAVKGLVIYYQAQERVALPASYPWSIFMSGNNGAVEDVELLGSWNGIAAIAAHRHYIARVQGQPVNIGLFVDETYDIGRIEDVHWNPWFSNKEPFIHYQTLEGRAFVFGRSDWEYVFNTFAFAYAVGYHFIERATGSMNGNFLGIGMDLATNASVLVEQSQPMGVLITNGEFTAFCDDTGAAGAHSFCGNPESNPQHVVVENGNNGAVKFVNSAFWGPAYSIATVSGKGTVTFSQCHFDSWDNHMSGGKYIRQGTPAITQLGGNLIVAMSDFTQGGAKLTHLNVDGGAKVIFSQNVIQGSMNVIGKGTVKHIVSDNADG